MFLGKRVFDNVFGDRPTKWSIKKKKKKKKKTQKKKQQPKKKN
jgi:hypothetical protein